MSSRPTKLQTAVLVSVPVLALLAGVIWGGRVTRAAANPPPGRLSTLSPDQVLVAQADLASLGATCDAWRATPYATRYALVYAQQERAYRAGFGNDEPLPASAAEEIMKIAVPVYNRINQWCDPDAPLLATVTVMPAAKLAPAGCPCNVLAPA